MKIGSKVRLIEMQEETRMPTGLIGTVRHIDDAGQIHVQWQNGSNLALIPGVDTYEQLEEAHEV